MTSYHDSVAGPGGKEDVVRIGWDPAISPLDETRHILTDALNALAGAVRTLNEN